MNPKETYKDNREEAEGSLLAGEMSYIDKLQEIKGSCIVMVSRSIAEVRDMLQRILCNGDAVFIGSCLV